MRGGGGCGISVNECSCAHGAQINFVSLLLSFYDKPFYAKIQSFGMYAFPPESKDVKGYFKILGMGK
jgi:hypothetical protein